MKVILESLNYERGVGDSEEMELNCHFEYSICNKRQVRINMDTLVGKTPNVETSRFKMKSQVLCEFDEDINLIDEKELIETCLAEIVSQIFTELIPLLDDLTKK